MVHFRLEDLPPAMQKQVKEKLVKNTHTNASDKESSIDSQTLNSTVDAYAKKSLKSSLVKVDGNSISVVHQKLWDIVKHLSGATLEYKGAVPNRRFSLDIAFPELKIAIEVDGWEFHGKHKSAHLRDREKQNLLVLNGWRVLRYTAKQILGKPEQCLMEIENLIVLVSNQ